MQISFAYIIRRQISYFLRKILIVPFKQVSWLRHSAPHAFSLKAMAYSEEPVRYSDRIARDFHPVPYYLSRIKFRKHLNSIR